MAEAIMPSLRDDLRPPSKMGETDRIRSVLAVGAHPDDVEVGCFGTLLKHKAAGDRVTVVVTTRGGYGRRSWEQILEEAKTAAGYLGLEYTILDNRIGHYEMTWKTVSELDDIIMRYDVDTVYTVWHGDSHQDHQMTFKNVLAACRTRRIESLFCFEQSEYSYRSQETFNARYFVDITDYFETKLEALRAYKSYITDAHIEAVRGLAKHRGLACGAEYAEAFEPIFVKWK